VNGSIDGEMPLPTTPDPADPHPRGRVYVLDTEMSYASIGEGDPIVFARQPDLLLSLAQYHTACAQPGTVPRPRPGRHGALRAIAHSRLSVRGPRPLS